AAAATHPSSRSELPATADRRISASAAAVQPEWTCSASRYAPGGGGRFPCSNGCAHKSSEGRLSIRNSCSWQASSRRKPFFARQICGRGGISSRYGSEGSLHGQNFSRPIIGVTCASAAALSQVNLKNLWIWLSERDAGQLLLIPDAGLGAPRKRSLRQKISQFVYGTTDQTSPSN